MGAKIENPPHFTMGRGWKEKHHNLFCRKDNDANIVDMNGKTKPLPIMLSRGCI